jgi:ATP adenylyltransferase
VFSQSIIQHASQRALADGALQPIETQTVLLDSDGVRFVLRTVSSLARKDKARQAVAAADPLGDYEPSLFVGELGPSHYVLLNKFQVLDGHVLIVTRRFERQERLLGVDDFAALIACLGEVDGLGFYNGGGEPAAQASAARAAPARRGGPGRRTDGARARHRRAIAIPACVRARGAASDGA